MDESSPPILTSGATARLLLGTFRCAPKKRRFGTELSWRYGPVSVGAASAKGDISATCTRSAMIQTRGFIRPETEEPRCWVARWL